MKLFNKLTALVGIVMILSFAVACGSKPNDEQIQANVDKQLQENQALRGITATVKDGVVTLSGNCEGEDCVTLAAQEVEKAEGVQQVENNVQRNEGTDLTLRTSVQSIISKYAGVQADVAAGVIVLRGTIARDQVQPLMNELHALQPKKLDNQLAVQ